MTADPSAPRSPAGPAGDLLEDRVYRAVLGEGNRDLAGASPWRTVPVTLLVLGLCGGLAVLLGRSSGPGDVAPPSVDLVLQEGPEPAAREPGGGSPRPAPAPVRTPAPAPPTPAPAAPPAPALEPPRDRVPGTPPADLPRVDPSRDAAGGAGSGAGGGPGAGGGSGSGPGSGSGAGTGGTGPGSIPAARVVALTSSQVQVKYQPPLPPYPRLAQLARIEGTVVVEITIGADGVPLRAQALEGPYQLRAAAEGYALAWRFRPHLENGVAMVARFDLSVRFRLTS